MERDKASFGKLTTELKEVENSIHEQFIKFMETGIEPEGMHHGWPEDVWPNLSEEEKEIVREVLGVI